MGIANLDRFTGTKEEKDLLAGQLYFFRGWFHFELMQFFGGLPYIDKAFSADDKLTLPRPTYQECAEKAAEDFRKAADLLPMDWDQTVAGRNTLGKNQLRVTKAAALGYLGKDLLFAASPLMNRDSGGTADYNKELCKRAAEAFGELLAAVEGGQTQFGLLPFEEYSQNFYTIDQNGKIAGQTKDNSITEAIFRGPDYGWNNTNWGLSKQFFACNADLNDGGVLTLPTANYVNYYGMANGLPLTDAESGFDNTHPWKDRDPRFYNDIKFDGCRLIKGDLGKQPASLKTADLQTGGAYRSEDKGSRTGYLLYKFIDVTCNKIDQGYGYSHHFNIHLPWMRLADVYLMKAEAILGNNAETSDAQALAAFNAVRVRAGVEPYTKITFSDLIRERRIEFCMEYCNWWDMVTWYRWKPQTMLDFFNNKQHRGFEIRENNLFKNADGTFSYRCIPPGVKTWYIADSKGHVYWNDKLTVSENDNTPIQTAAQGYKYDLNSLLRKYVPGYQAITLSEANIFMPYPESDVIQNHYFNEALQAYNFGSGK